MQKSLTVLAMTAHPDDIEFLMSGTLMLLKETGADIHICNLANGCYGSEVTPPKKLSTVRAGEAQAAAKLIGATWHRSLFDDLGIFYNAPSLAKVTAIIRRIKPDVVLTLALRDYMEDHCVAARLTSSATFNRCIPYYVSDPAEPSYSNPVALYHVLPHSLMDMERHMPSPDFVVDVSSVIDLKREMLAMHKSQEGWLDSTQRVSYIESMVERAREIGERFGKSEFAEGWIRHNHMGYCDKDFDPVRERLGDLCHTLSE